MLFPKKLLLCSYAVHGWVGVHMYALCYSVTKYAIRRRKQDTSTLFMRS